MPVMILPLACHLPLHSPYWLLFDGEVLKSHHAPADQGVGLSQRHRTPDFNGAGGEGASLVGLRPYCQYPGSSGVRDHRSLDAGPAGDVLCLVLHTLGDSTGAHSDPHPGGTRDTRVARYPYSVPSLSPPDHRTSLSTVFPRRSSDCG
jgi:hypothetical protein